MCVCVRERNRESHEKRHNIVNCEIVYVCVLRSSVQLIVECDSSDSMVYM